MFKRCSNCKHCVIDIKALNIGIYVDKCHKKKHIIINPFWKGWRCKEWVKEDGK